jgi:futalosine hydrolase
MQILIVAATHAEIEPLIERFKTHHSINFLVTGVGMVATAYSLGRHLATQRFDMAINLGIAGSFKRDIDLGQVVEIISDELAELGAEDDGDFLPIETLGFGKSKYYPSTSIDSCTEVLKVERLNAVTVNTVHGNDASIRLFTGRFKPAIESMEGAAFFYACAEANVPCLQIRAVSNYVEKRNRDNWKIGLAVKNLNNFAAQLLDIIISNEH